MVRPVGPHGQGTKSRLCGFVLLVMAALAAMSLPGVAQGEDLPPAVSPVPPAPVARGVTLFDQRRYAEAKALLAQAVADDPANAQAQAYLGRVFADFDHDPDQAVAHLLEAVKLAPANSAYHQWLGSAYGDMADKVGVFKGPHYANLCREELEKGVQLDPKSVEARDSLFDYYLQAPGFVGGGLDKARREAAALFQLNPSRGLLDQAKIARREKDKTLAEALYRKAVAADPADGRPYDALGHFLLDQGRAEDAVAVFRDFVKARPKDPEAHADLAEGLFAQGRIDQSLVECEKAIQLDPFYPDTYLDRARCFEARGAWPQAREAYGRYLELVPGGKNAEAVRKKVRALKGQ